MKRALWDSRPRAAPEGPSRAGQPWPQSGQRSCQSREAGQAHMFLIRGPGAPGCCHLDPRAIAEITPVFPHTLNPSQWMIWALPPPPPTNANSGRLLALGGFCYELIKLTLSS